MENQHPCLCPLAKFCSRAHGPFREVRRPQHSILFVQGQPAAQVYFIRRGTASLHRMSTEDRALGRTRALRHPNSFLGLEGLIDEEYQDSARAETPLVLCMASRERVTEWVGENSDASVQVLKTVLRTEDDELIPQSATDGTALQRTAAWILDQEQREKTAKVPRRVVADLLGMRPETLSRAIHQLAEAGLIEASRGSFFVIDPDGLRSKTSD